MPEQRITDQRLKPRPSISDLRTCIKAQHSRLKDMDGILTDVIFAAVTGEGLEDLRENRYWRDLAEKERWRRSSVKPTAISGPAISDEAIASHERPGDAVIEQAQKVADAYRNTGGLFSVRLADPVRQLAALLPEKVVK